VSILAPKSGVNFLEGSFLFLDVKRLVDVCMMCPIPVIAATMLAAQSIQLGVNDIVVAGGMENMSNVPKYIADARLILSKIFTFNLFILLYSNCLLVIVIPRT
jgi:hypothetical protein